MKVSVVRSSIIGVMALGLGFMAGCSGSDTPYIPTTASSSSGLGATLDPARNIKANASMAWIAYSGEKYGTDPVQTVYKIADYINTLLPANYPNLTGKGWKVVWGPALVIYPDTRKYILGQVVSGYAPAQANLTFVAQSLDAPSNYIVATRGTVGPNTREWLTEDLAVDFKSWPTTTKYTALTKVIDTPHVSTATAFALQTVLTTTPPPSNPSVHAALPGAGQTLTQFLTALAGLNKPVSVSFTGHSLGGAIAPALALWFTQAQGIATIVLPNTLIPKTIANDYIAAPNGWDVNSKVAISCVSFAGATPGDTTFSAYFSSKLGSKYTRIYNTNDIVPRGFNRLTSARGIYAPLFLNSTTNKTLANLLYSKIIDVDKAQLIGVKYATLTQFNPDTDAPFTFPLGPPPGTAYPFAQYTSYTTQFIYQHNDAYANTFGLTSTNP